MASLRHSPRLDSPLALHSFSMWTRKTSSGRRRSVELTPFRGHFQVDGDGVGYHRGYRTRGLTRTAVVAGGIC